MQKASPEILCNTRLEDRDYCCRPATIFFMTEKTVATPVPLSKMAASRIECKRQYFARCEEHGWSSVHQDRITREEYIVSQIMNS